MYKDLSSNKKAISFLKNELKFDRESGTYLFYGPDRDLLKLFAKSFAKSLNCDNEKDDFCGECENCIRIESETHGDLEILEDANGIKIERVRNIIYNDSISSYEGKKKIYIICDIEKLRKESANALLKVIEEPNLGNFIIMTASHLNILPTIKSRSILLNIVKETAEELGVTEEEFKFFLGSSKEIKLYKNIPEADLSVPNSFEQIGKNINKWVTIEEFKYKIEIYKSIIDFINVREYINLSDKLYFINEILFNSIEKDSGSLNRNLIREIITYTLSILNLQNHLNLEELVELKNISKIPVNLKNLLISFYTKI